MFTMGEVKPARMTAGIMKTTDPSRACCMVVDREETRSPRPDHGADEAGKSQEKSGDCAVKRDMKPEHRTQRKEQGIQKAEEHAGQELADQDFSRDEGGHQELVKGSELAFPGHEETGEDHDHHDQSRRSREYLDILLKI